MSLNQSASLLVAWVLTITLATAPDLAGAHNVTPDCPVPNAAKPAATGGKRQKGKNRRPGNKQAMGSATISLQPDAQSASKSVNLGTDREAEKVTLRATVASPLPKGYARRFSLVAEPFISASETDETVTFGEPSFSRLRVSENGKRLTVTMCVDPPNDLPAGKYTGTVLLEGPASIEPAVMTITFNAKDGCGFALAAIVTALLAYFLLLYKAAGAKRAENIADAKPEGSAKEMQEIEDEARSWRRAFKECFLDLGWQVPALASIGAAFAILWAAYTDNPAWGEGGIVTSAIALIGAGLAAVGANTVVTRPSSSD